MPVDKNALSFINEETIIRVLQHTSTKPIRTKSNLQHCDAYDQQSIATCNEMLNRIQNLLPYTNNDKEIQHRIGQAGLIIWEKIWTRWYADYLWNWYQFINKNQKLKFGPYEKQNDEYRKALTDKLQGLEKSLNLTQLTYRFPEALVNELHNHIDELRPPEKYEMVDIQTLYEPNGKKENPEELSKYDWVNKFFFSALSNNSQSFVDPILDIQAILSEMVSNIEHHHHHQSFLQQIDNFKLSEDAS